LFALTLDGLAADLGLGAGRHLVLIWTAPDSTPPCKWRQSGCRRACTCCTQPPTVRSLQPAERLWPLTNEALANRTFENLGPHRSVGGALSGAQARARYGGAADETTAGGPSRHRPTSSGGLEHGMASSYGHLYYAPRTVVPIRCAPVQAPPLEPPQPAASRSLPVRRAPQSLAPPVHRSVPPRLASFAPSPLRARRRIAGGSAPCLCRPVAKVAVESQSAPDTPRCRRPVAAVGQQRSGGRPTCAVICSVSGTRCCTSGAWLVSAWATMICRSPQTAACPLYPCTYPSAALHDAALGSVSCAAAWGVG